MLFIAFLVLACFANPLEARAAEPLSLHVNNPPEIGEQESFRLLIAKLRDRIRGSWLNFPLDRPLYAKVRFTLMEDGSVKRISMPVPSLNMLFDQSCVKAVDAAGASKGFIYPLEIEARFDNFTYYKYATGLDGGTHPPRQPSMPAPIASPLSPATSAPPSEPRRITFSGSRRRVETHTILKNMSGKLLELDDGSIYEVDPTQQYITGIWLEHSDVKVIDDSEMINEDDDEIVKVRRIK
ncbi:MAG: TonB C-terminal domain-containing protein [Candidatus Obscuribacter sp.]|nr:TonB C-terminal domain-containing protein [Candidatus Obscuribacter sp.]